MIDQQSKSESLPMIYITDPAMDVEMKMDQIIPSLNEYKDHSKFFMEHDFKQQLIQRISTDLNDRNSTNQSSAYIYIHLYNTFSYPTTSWNTYPEPDSPSARPSMSTLTGDVPDLSDEPLAAVDMDPHFSRASIISKSYICILPYYCVTLFRHRRRTGHKKR